ncbi:MAG: flagellar biosynthesis anti-sigma factor FlgM [Firmicutes bacterium]|nr:flagellar biosynthesis anti-sigma factor FlgM [Bacillota bacterium]
MYISNKSVHRIGRIYEQNKAAKPSKKAADNKDKVILSDEGKELQVILNKVYSPQKPSAKAETLKKKIVSGDYYVKGEDIAASMIKYFKQRV